MVAHEIIRSWPHDWYGFWRSPAHDYDDVPTVQAVSDPMWNPRDKGRLIAYLDRCPIIGACMARVACLLCTVEVAAFSFQSDGRWFWPRSLPHYVGCHSVVLPDRLVAHIRERDYIPPTEAEVPDVPVRDLPWPESCGGMRKLGF